MRFWGSVSLLLMAMAGTTLGQTQGATSAAPPKPAVQRRFNELTLAGLRPGRDAVRKAIQLFGKPDYALGRQANAGVEFRTSRWKLIT